jgi:chorismate synthase
MANTFGKIFSITSFGESHGPAIGVVIDGVPGCTPIDLKEIQRALDRRRPGQSCLTSPRAEQDAVQCLSGLENGIALGTPLTLVVTNTDQRPQDYGTYAKALRPSHADYTTWARYGMRSASGGGRASARETIARVAAGSVAKQILKHMNCPLEASTYVTRVGNMAMASEASWFTLEEIDRSPVRCPVPSDAKLMQDLIETVMAEGDSVGGVIHCRIRGVPPGLGAPVFDKLEADLAKAMLSLPAVKGFEIGSGFYGTTLRGSEHNDPFVLNAEGSITTSSNHSGGIQGGISNGQEIYFNVGFKPVATIRKSQPTVELVHPANGSNSPTPKEVQLAPQTTGRHDPCVLPRAVPIVESMAFIVLCDHFLRFQTAQSRT